MKCFIAPKGFSNFDSDGEFIGVIKEEDNIRGNLRPLITEYVVEKLDCGIDESVDFDSLSEDDFWAYIDGKFEIFIEETKIID